jgi:hypothetical protein
MYRKAEAETHQHEWCTMTDDTDTIDDASRVTRRDLIEGKVDKVSGGTEAIPVAAGDIDFANFRQMIDYAKVMSTAGPILVPWLQGNVGGVLSMMLRAKELNISFLTLQSWSYTVENRGVQSVAFMSQFFTAVINTRAPIKERLKHEIIGEGDERRCKVWATLKGETEPRVFLSDTLAKLRPPKNESGKTKGSPLWDTKPDLQLFYNASRDFARVYFPDILGGVYGVDEMEDAGAQVGPQHAKDVSPGLRERLRGPVGEGFQHSKSSIEASIAAATPVDEKKSGKAAPARPASQSAGGDAAPAGAASSSARPPGQGGGAVSDQPKEQAT